MIDLLTPEEREARAKRRALHEQALRRVGCRKRWRHGTGSSGRPQGLRGRARTPEEFRIPPNARPPDSAA